MLDCSSNVIIWLINYTSLIKWCLETVVTAIV